MHITRKERALLRGVVDCDELEGGGAGQDEGRTRIEGGSAKPRRSPAEGPGSILSLSELRASAEGTECMAEEKDATLPPLLAVRSSRERQIIRKAAGT